jgi:2'-5' RNA ligase
MNWFVGLPVPAGSWLEPLLTGAPADVQRLHPDDLHITVAFLGHVERDAAERAWAVVHDFEPGNVPVRLSGLEPMGNPRRPTALSVMLDEGHDETVALITAVRAPILEAAGVLADRYGVKPHITVARPARKADARARGRAVAWAKAVPPIGATVTLDRIALYTWSADRRLRKFRVVHDKALAGE